MIDKLADYNKIAYEKVKEAFVNGESVAGIVQASGTKKALIAIMLAYDNPDKKFLFAIKNKSEEEYIENLIVNELGLNREKDFKNLSFRTYISLGYSYDNDSKELEKNRLCNLDVDYLLINDLSILGSPVQGSAINEIINTHEKLKVFGMTSVTVRD